MAMVDGDGNGDGRWRIWGWRSLEIDDMVTGVIINGFCCS